MFFYYPFVYLFLFSAGNNTLPLDFSKASYVSLENQVERENSLALVKVEESTILKEIEIVRSFYINYTTNIVNNSPLSSNDSLVRKFFTSDLEQKIIKLRIATNSDPVIRAQDFREDVISTIHVTHLEDKWYLVSYIWKYNNIAKQICIPLRMNIIDGQYKIDYITPVWNGNEYGDHLLLCR